MEAFGAALFSKEQNFPWQEVQMILAEGLQYLQGLLTGDLNEADICHKYHQERWS